MSLSQNVHTLTRPHLSTGPHGKLTEQPPLLQELQDAVHPSECGSGGAGKSKTKIPINPDAVDLIAKIQHEAATDHIEMRGWRLVGTTTQTLQSYTTPIYKTMPDTEWETYLEHVTHEWINQIEQLVRPRKPRRKLVGTECPSCEQKYHGEERAVCLTADCWGTGEDLLHPSEWHVQCEGCGAQWSGDTLKWFIRALGTVAA